MGRRPSGPGEVSHTRTSSTRTFRGWSRAKPTHPTQGKAFLSGGSPHSLSTVAADTSTVTRVGVCMARDDQKSSRSVMRSQCTFHVCGEGVCPGPTHGGHRGGGDEGTVVLAPLRMGRSAAWLSAQYHAQFPPSRKQGQTQSGLTRARNTQCIAQGRARLETRQTCVGAAVWVLSLR